jgi:hypothetical protein
MVMPEPVVTRRRPASTCTSKGGMDSSMPGRANSAVPSTSSNDDTPLPKQPSTARSPIRMAHTVANMAFPPLSGFGSPSYGRTSSRRTAAGEDPRMVAVLDVALVVKLTAAPGSEDDLASFLTGAEALATEEAGTPVWLALRTDESTFWIVDAFPGDDERNAHLAGPIAAGLMEASERLLATAPEILFADVLASSVAPATA